MSVADTTVKYFVSSMPDLGGMSYASGQAIGKLDKILVDGFNSVSVSSIVTSSGVATVTTSSAHGFLMISTATGPVVTISGATPTELNREWRIASVVDTTSFTIDVTGIVDDGSATGTMSVKYSPLGWETLFTGTNIRVYGRTDAGATESVLQVSETANGYYCTLTAAESASDVSTLVGGWGSKRFFKTITTSTTTYLPWSAIGNSRGVYLFQSNDSFFSGVNCIAGFFDLINLYGDADTHACVLKGTTISSGSDTYAAYNNTANARIKRLSGASGADTGADIMTYTHPKNTGYWAAMTGSLNNTASGKAHLVRAEAWESNGPRGVYPGIYDLLCNKSGVTQGQMIYGGGPSSNKNYMLHLVNATAAFAIDLTGPWE